MKSFLTKDERNIISKEIDAGAIAKGFSVYGFDGDNVYRNSNPELCGLCGACKYMCEIKTEFRHLRLHCERYDIPLHLTDKINTCTGYEKRGSLDIADMKKIATIINVDKNGVVGFINGLRDED